MIRTRQAMPMLSRVLTSTSRRTIYGGWNTIYSPQETTRLLEEGCDNEAPTRSSLNYVRVIPLHRPKPKHKLQGPGNLTSAKKEDHPDSDVRITARDPLPEHIQKSVDEKLADPCLHQPFNTKRHIVRHWRMDSRKGVKKSKRKALRDTEFPVSPYLLIGAYQKMVQRALVLEDTPYKDCVTVKTVLTADVPFGWFLEASDQLAGKNHDQRFKFGKGTPSNIRNLIVMEALAMLLRPKIEPYLPPHAWALSYEEEPKKPSSLTAPPSVIDIHQFLQIALQISGNNPARKTQLTAWNCGQYNDETKGEEKVVRQFDFDIMHRRVTVNMLQPYMPKHLVDILSNLHTSNAVGCKKKAKWMWEAEKGMTMVNSLPALLLDICMLRMDFSEHVTKRTHPLFKEAQECLLSDRKKKFMGYDEGYLPKFPKTIDGSVDISHYFRYGPLVGLVYRGPKVLQEKIERTIEMELQSALAFHKKMVKGQKEIVDLAMANRVGSKKGKNKKKKKKKPKAEMEEDKKLKALEEKFEQDELVYAEFRAGKIAWQEELKEMKRRKAEKSGTNVLQKERNPKSAKAGK